MMSERKHADLWKELVDEAGDEEIDRAASVSVAQAEAELAAAGFDVAAERAKASAFLERAGRAEAPSRARPRRRPPRARRSDAPQGAARPGRVAGRGGVVRRRPAARLYAALQPELVGSPPPPTPS